MYIVDAILSALVCCCGGFNFLIGGPFLIGLLGFISYVTIWNYTQYEIVFDTMWVMSEWENAILVMKFMWWIRAIIGSLWTCICGCTSLCMIPLACSALVSCIGNMELPSLPKRTDHGNVNIDFTDIQK